MKPSSLPQSSAGGAAPCACNQALHRRDFLEWGGAAMAGLALSPLPVMAGPFEPADTADHFVPADKKLKPDWIKALFERSGKQWYDGPNLKMIGMPVGGITTGQLYLGGDGKLLYWDIYNRTTFTGYGATNYFAEPATSPLEQGFSVSLKSPAGNQSRTLDREGFPGVRFCGEYPMAWVEYQEAGFPLTATLEAFSPFCPLKEEDSSLPVTVMRFTVKNTSAQAVEAELAGRLQNAVCRHSAQDFSGRLRNTVVRDQGWTMVLSAAKAVPAETPTRPPLVLETFEGDNYGLWKTEGEAFGKGPARGAFPRQQAVSGFAGKGLVNTYFSGSDQTQGKLRSPPFKIERHYLCFLIGGGNHAGKTCINLLVDGQVARTLAGRNDEKLVWRHWSVRELSGKEARLEIVDAESGPWGHINIDQIEQRDTPATGAEGPLEKQIDFGTMGLAVLEADGVFASASGLAASSQPTREAALSDQLVGQLAKTLTLRPGEAKTVTFLVAWHFPNRGKEGNRYATGFKDAADVVRHVASNFDRLHRQTILWHDTWYEQSTLPRWLLDRLFSTVSTLATGTALWWANGRFWAWEGVGCCPGTCAHVWNYEHALARLFPNLERSVRIMQDLEPTAGLSEKTGSVAFRGSGNHWAGDSQGGTAMKCLREHQMTAEGAFLKEYWPRIRKTIQFLIDQDGNGDGLIEGIQHNTYDINFFGANTMVGSLYLGALRAGEEMAREVGDAEFAATCRRLFEAGRDNTLRRLWNGEYFIQQVDHAKYADAQYGDGCLSDQLFGQGWAHQVGLGYLYPRDKVASALKAIWTYNWAPDVGPQNAKHKPERWFARPGEAGLFTCTWPKSKHMGQKSVRYRDEIWTGIEYQVAGHMVWEGLLTEALAICRGIHDRYHPARHNPWNEIECGDHYARGMASYGVFLALCGFEYHGPKRHLGFAPKIAPEKFSAAFTAAEGWGVYAQQIRPDSIRAQIQVKWGRVRLRTLSIGLPRGAIPARASLAVAGQDQRITLEVQEGKARLRLDEELTVNAGETVSISLG